MTNNSSLGKKLFVVFCAISLILSLSVLISSRQNQSDERPREKVVEYLSQNTTFNPCPAIYKSIMYIGNGRWQAKLITPMTRSELRMGFNGEISTQYIIEDTIIVNRDPAEYLCKPVKTKTPNLVK